MTVDTAIYRLKNQIYARLYNPKKEDEEALVMAVNALTALKSLNASANNLDKGIYKEE